MSKTECNSCGRVSTNISPGQICGHVYISGTCDGVYLLTVPDWGVHGMKFTECIGYKTLIAAYYSACDRHDWYWCDVLRPLIVDAILAEHAEDVKVESEYIG